MKLELKGGETLFIPSTWSYTIRNKEGKYFYRISIEQSFLNIIVSATTNFSKSISLINNFNLQSLP